MNQLVSACCLPFCVSTPFIKLIFIQVVSLVTCSSVTPLEAASLMKHLLPRESGSVQGAVYNLGCGSVSFLYKDQVGTFSDPTP